jgi:hypothetical protein
MATTRFASAYAHAVPFIPGSLHSLLLQLKAAASTGDMPACHTVTARATAAQHATQASLKMRCSITTHFIPLAVACINSRHKRGRLLVACWNTCH